MDGVFRVSFDHYHLTLTFNCKIKVVGIVYASNRCIKTFLFIPMLIQNHYKEDVTCSRAEPQQTPSVEKHAPPPRVVYCAIYLTLTLITKFRVSNLHITTR